MKSRLKVLIAEDDLIIHQIIKEVLEPKFTLEFTTNGQDTIDKAIEIVPDLILLDIMMPEIDGIQACREMRKISELRKTIIVMVTALSDEDSKKKAIRAGADEFISKPFNPFSLKSKVLLLLRLRDRLLFSN